MKSFSFFAVALLTLLLVPLLSPAQESRAAPFKDLMENTTPEERATIQTRKMTETLHLNPAQTEAVAKINVHYAKKMQQTYNSNEGRLRKFRVMRRFRDAKESELRSVLTEDQFDKYLARRAEMRERILERKR